MTAGLRFGRAARLGLAGAVGGALVGVVDGALAPGRAAVSLDGVGRLVGILHACSLDALVGAALGVGLGVLSLVAPRVDLALWIAAMQQPPLRRIAARVALAPVAGVVLVAGLYHAAHAVFVGTADRTLGAAVVLCLAAGLGAVAALSTLRLGRALGEWADRRGFSPRALVASGGAAGLALLLVGIRSGSTAGVGGPLGFLGLLRKDELDLRPLVALVAIALGAPVLAARLRGVRGRRFALGAASVLAGALAFTTASYGARPEVADAVEGGGALAPLALRAARRALDRDGDGHAGLLGGGDCDDGDPRRSPGARDVPGNGIDEDCSGRDLAATSPEEPAAQIPASDRARLPEDLSIVLLTVDTLRADVGWAGYARDVTPNLDRWAARSVRYSRVEALSSYTGKALAPMLIGRYASECPRDGGHFTRYRAPNEFVAEGLRAAGFRTAAVLSHFYFRLASGLEQGFDVWDLEATPRGEGSIDTRSSSREVSDRAIVRLREVQDASRFFLWVHYLDPHREYLQHPEVPSFGTGRRDLYDHEVRFTDLHAGRFLDALAASPAAGRTALVVTSDHGEAFGEHGTRFHGWELWEELLRVPLFVYVPTVPPRDVRRRVGHIDLAPTLYELAGVDAPSGLRGQSLLPEILGADLPARDIYAELPAGPHNQDRRAFFHDRWKLLWRGRYLLFDLEADPDEKHDLAAERPEILEEMKDRYLAYRAGLDEVDPAPAVTTEP